MTSNARTLHRMENKVPSLALDELRAWLRNAGLREGDRLPAERHLAGELGLSRGSLRQALAAAESAGEIWRHVGKGTFVGALSGASDGQASQLAQNSNPIELIEARALLEPKLAALAALRGTPQSFAALRVIVSKGRAANDAKSSHLLGNDFHYAIARMAGNQLLLGLFDALFKVRSLNSWGKLRPALSTASEMGKLWGEHSQICEAITGRDAREAEALMRLHIDHLHRAISSGQDAMLSTQDSTARWPDDAAASQTNPAPG